MRPILGNGNILRADFGSLDSLLYPLNFPLVKEKNPLTNTRKQHKKTEVKPNAPNTFRLRPCVGDTVESANHDRSPSKRILPDRAVVSVRRPLSRSRQFALSLSG